MARHGSHLNRGIFYTEPSCSEKSLAVLYPGPCQGGERNKISLEILLVKPVYNSKPVLDPFSLLIWIYPGFEVQIKDFIDHYSSSPSLFILQSFWDKRLWHSWAWHAKKHPCSRSTQLYCQKGLWGCKKIQGKYWDSLAPLSWRVSLALAREWPVNPDLGSHHSERAREEQRWGLCPPTAGKAAPFFVLRLFSNIFVQFFLSFLLP